MILILSSNASKSPKKVPSKIFSNGYLLDVTILISPETRKNISFDNCPLLYIIASASTIKNLLFYKSFNKELTSYKKSGNYLSIGNIEANIKYFCRF